MARPLQLAQPALHVHVAQTTPACFVRDVVVMDEAVAALAWVAAFRGAGTIAEQVAALTAARKTLQQPHAVAAAVDISMAVLTSAPCTNLHHAAALLFGAASRRTDVSPSIPALITACITCTCGDSCDCNRWRLSALATVYDDVAAREAVWTALRASLLSDAEGGATPSTPVALLAWCGATMGQLVLQTPASASPDVVTAWTRHVVAALRIAIYWCTECAENVPTCAPPRAAAIREHLIDVCAAALRCIACEHALRDVTAVGTQLLAKALPLLLDASALHPLAASACSTAVAVDATTRAALPVPLAELWWRGEGASATLRLAWMRGILASWPAHILMHPSTAFEDVATSPLNAFTRVLLALSVSPLVSVRVQACGALECLLTSALACQHATCTDETLPRFALHDAVAHDAAACARMLSQIVDSILLNWQHTSRSVTELMAPCFNLVWQVYDASNLAADARAVQALSRARAFHSIMGLPAEETSRYYALDALLFHMDGHAMLVESPALVSDLLDTLAHPSLNLTPLRVCLHVLTSARTYMEGRCGLPCIKYAGSPARWIRGAAATQAAEGAPHVSACLAANHVPHVAQHAISRDGFVRMQAGSAPASLQSSVAACAAAHDIADISAACETAVTAVHNLVAAMEVAAVPGKDLQSLLTDELLRCFCYRRWVSMWLPHVMHVCMHIVRTRRLRVVTLMLRDVLILDDQSPPVLLESLYTAAVPTTASIPLLHDSDDMVDAPERLRWALVAVARAGVANTTVFRDVTTLHLIGEPTRANPHQTDVMCALLAPDADTRCLAFDLLCVVADVRIPLHRTAITMFFATSLKLSVSEARKTVCAGTAALLRTMRGIVKPIGRAARLAAASSPDAVGTACMLLRTIVRMLCECMTPDAPIDRVCLPLDVLTTLLDGTQECEPLRIAVSEEISACSLAVSLVSVMVSQWERTRESGTVMAMRLAHDFVARGEAFVASLIEFALILTASTRQREHEAGARLLRVCAHVCSCCDVRATFGANLNVHVARASDYMDEPLPDVLRILQAHGTFVDVLVDTTCARAHAYTCAIEAQLGHSHAPMSAELLGNGARHVHATTVPPLPHGLLLAVRFCVSDALVRLHAASTLASPHAAEVVRVWRVRLTRIADMARHVLHVACMVVAGSGETDGGRVGGPESRANANKPAEAMADAGYALGRVDCPPAMIMPASNASGASGAVAVDLSSVGRDLLSSAASPGGGDADDATQQAVDALTGTADADADEPLEEDESSGNYTLIIGSWETTRECASMLAQLVTGTRDNEFAHATHTTGRLALLAAPDVLACSNAILDALLCVRHTGCISTCAEALHAVCVCLMSAHVGVPEDTALVQLPTIWLQSLFQRVRLAAQFILRRSAGFAQAFIAILRAEIRNHASTGLLHDAMHHLLVYAGCDADVLASVYETVDTRPDVAPPLVSSWRTTVHSLNILRCIFLNASVGVTVHSYVPAVMRTCVRGFTHSAWAIRNSSLMCYAAVLHRCMSCDGRARTHASAFFDRFPSLHAFLLAELRACAQTRRDTHGALVYAHPGLFPLLHLLSQLEPPLAASDAWIELVDVAMSVCGHPHAHLRACAATAACSMTHADLVPAYIHRALTQASTALTASDWNTAHGLFLLVHALGARVPLGSVDVAPVAASVIALLQHRHDMPAFAAAAAVQALYTLREEQVDLSARPAPTARTPLVRPEVGSNTLVCATTDACTRHIVRDLIGGAADARERACARLASLLASKDSDVRLTAARVLKSNLKANAAGREQFTGAERIPELAIATTTRDMCEAVCLSLLPQLCTALATETHVHTTRYLAHALAHVSAGVLLSAHEGRARDAIVQACTTRRTWACLLAAYDTWEEGRTRAHLLVAAARMLSAGRILRGAAMTAVAREIGSRAMAAATQMRVWQLRAYAARALAATRVTDALGGDDSTASLVAARAWFCLLRLCDDFDDEVREMSRAAVCELFTPLQARPEWDDISAGVAAHVVVCESAVPLRAQLQLYSVARASPRAHASLCDAAAVVIADTLTIASHVTSLPHSATLPCGTQLFLATEDGIARRPAFTADKENENFECLRMLTLLRAVCGPAPFARVAASAMLAPSVARARAAMDAEEESDGVGVMGVEGVCFGGVTGSELGQLLRFIARAAAEHAAAEGAL